MSETTRSDSKAQHGETDTAACKSPVAMRPQALRTTSAYILIKPFDEGRASPIAQHRKQRTRTRTRHTGSAVQDQVVSTSCTHTTRALTRARSPLMHSLQRLRRAPFAVADPARTTPYYAATNLQASCLRLTRCAKVPALAGHSGRHPASRWLDAPLKTGQDFVRSSSRFRG